LIKRIKELLRNYEQGSESQGRGQNFLGCFLEQKLWDVFHFVVSSFHLTRVVVRWEDRLESDIHWLIHCILRVFHLIDAICVILNMEIVFEFEGRILHQQLNDFEDLDMSHPQREWNWNQKEKSHFHWRSNDDEC
jgi:hypothetical protein